MSFVKHYWFGLLIGLFLTAFAVLLVLILLSPKQDVKGRGFIACTQTMAAELINCERKIWCSGRAIAANTWCDVKVVGRGFADWIRGEQPRPWSNYIFAPELPQPLVDEEARREYLQKYPDVGAEMKRLHLLRKDLENERNTEENPEKLWPEE